MMDVWTYVIDFVLCWLKLVAIAASVPLGLMLLHRYCGAPYVLEREERKRAKRKKAQSWKS